MSADAIARPVPSTDIAYTVNRIDMERPWQ